MNKMKEIRIEKLTLNMGMGEAGDKLKKAVKLLSTVSNKKPVLTKSYKRIPTWGVRPGLEIGAKVSIRGENAKKMLERLFKAIDNRIKATSFDKYGNFSFGVKEYIDIPEVEYDPDIGIIGFEVAVTLERPRYRVKKRKYNKSKLGKNHVITKNEAIDYVQNNFGIKVGEEE